MFYYKVIKNGEFIGVGTERDLRRFQKVHNLLLISGVARAQYIEVNEKLYHGDIFLPVTTDRFKYEDATVYEISKEDFDALYAAIESNEEIVVEPDPPVVQEEPETPADETLETIIKLKLDELSKACRETIYAGADILLTDGTLHHFSFGLIDQINIDRLWFNAINGITDLRYHADDEEIKIYSKEDIELIKKQKDFLIDVCTIHHNALKMKVKQLTDKNEINTIHFDEKLPTE